MEGAPSSSTRPPILAPDHAGPAAAPDLPAETLAAFGGDDLRARVFHDKYALRARDGHVVERTPEQMWRRIARELASVEAPERREEWAANFTWLLEGFRFIPGGRIMHAAGNHRRVTALNCFPAGTPVLSNRGFIPIEHILPGDEVLTHRDRFGLVTHVIEREISEPLVELSFFYLGDRPIRCTANHRFLALTRGSRPEWVPAGELTRAHYVKVGRVTETIPLVELDVTDYLEGGALEDDEGRVFTATPFVGGQGAVGVREARRVRRRVRLDEAFGRWLGYFVAEGGLTENSVYFTLSKDEGRLADEVAALTRQVFGLDAAIQTRTDQPRHWMRVYVHSRLLVRFVKRFFDSRVASTDKLLPPWFLRASERVQKAFIGAVFAGDGVVLEKSVRLFLANPELIRQIYTILLRLNIVASIRWEKVLRLTKHRGMWIHVGTQRFVSAIKAWIDGHLDVESTLADAEKNYFYRVLDGEIFVKTKAIRRTDASRQTVYDLTVEDDHSFTVGWVGAHNCYVVPVKDDSIESIFDWMKEAARTYSLGGGVGTDISVLRPRGAPVNNAARSSTGSVSFMELFSLTTGTIGQSGRRGALMITIADNHPDVLDFIKVKRSLDRIRYANISVRISDAFMRAVEEDGTYDLVFENERATLRRTVRAREVWRELISGAHDCAEPGVIFWDTVKRWSTSEYNRMGVITTNPCSLVGSTYVMTPSGIHRLDRLVEHAVTDRVNPKVVIDRRAADGHGVAGVRADALAFTGVRRIYRVETTSGFMIRGTCDHKVKVLNDQTPDPLHGSTGWKRIDELQSGDVLAVMDPNDPGLVDLVFGDRSPHLHLNATWIQPRRRDAHYHLIDVPETWDDDLAYLLGYAVGDGCYATHSRRREARRLDIHMHVEDAPHVKPIIDRVTDRCLRSRRLVAVGAGASEAAEPYPLRLGEGTNRAWVSVHSAAFMRMLGALGLQPAVAHEKTVPDAVLAAPREATAAFLRGLFDADGTVSRPGDQPMISLSSTSRRLSEQVQLLLLQFGIFSAVTTYRAEDKNASRASRFTYVTKAGEAREYQSVHDSHRLCIGGYPSIERFAAAIGSALPRRQRRIEALRAARRMPLRDVTAVTRVARVVDEGISEAVYDLTVLDTKSFVANGLIVSNSEIPLEPYGNCCLGNVNLARFVRDEFTSQARVDWEPLERALRYATRFLDNVLDYNADKHPLPQQREASLYSRRIGVGFTGLGDMLIMLGLRYDSDPASTFVDGLFDRIKNTVYDESVTLAVEKGAFPGYDARIHPDLAFVQTLTPRVRERIQRHGLRNVALLTVPPVGSGAALAGVTSGIEPIFDLSYVRRSESLSQEFFTVYHPLVREYMSRFGVERQDDLPDYFVTTHKIRPEPRVRMQAVIQRHVDHSISSTVNLAQDAPLEDVERIYFLAWKMGCKGITVYRAGSRENILTATSEKKPGIYLATKGTLEALYREQGKSLSEIAQVYGTNTGVVHRVFTRLGIERRKASEAADETATKSISLTESAIELLEGELLGGGSLRRYKNGAAFVYTTKHYDYATWLVRELERHGMECSDIAEYQHEAGNVVFEFQTLSYKELGVLYDSWYDPQGNKRLPGYFPFTPIRLRQWFIGDGSNVTESKAKYLACYSAFSSEDKARLKGMLEQILGRSLVFDEGGNKLCINADAVKAFFDYIGPCPVGCYEYKWKGGEHVLSVREPGAVYPEESAPEVPLGRRGGLPAAPPEAHSDRPARTTPRTRPKVTAGRTERIETPRGRVYVVVNEDELGICEVFVHSLDAEAEAIGRMASLALRGGLDPRDVIEQLWRAQSNEVAFDRSADGTVVRVSTIAQAVALALGRGLYGEGFRPDKAFPRADALPEPGPRVRQEALRFAPAAGGTGLAPVAGGTGLADLPPGMAMPRQGPGAGFAGICPDCGASLVHENGCATCRQCGYARC